MKIRRFAGLVGGRFLVLAIPAFAGYADVNQFTAGEKNRLKTPMMVTVRFLRANWFSKGDDE